MIKNLLVFFGLRKAQQSFMRRNGAMLAPIGGVVPALGWLAWQNRAKLKSMYAQHVAPKLGQLTKKGSVSTARVPRPSSPSYSSAI